MLFLVQAENRDAHTHTHTPVRARALCVCVCVCVCCAYIPDAASLFTLSAF